MTGTQRPTPPPVPWEEEQSRRWLAHLELREAPLLPVLDALLDRSGLAPGERVLDVGCGAGPTTGAAARLVGPSGRVTGVDVSPAMIAAARNHVGDDGVDWLVADAARHTFAPQSYDVVISRFGVMFFADPVAAFANLAAACRAGGRAVFAVWPLRDRSDFFSRPLDVLAATFRRLGVPLVLPPPDRGPFALGAPEQLRETLTAAGWSDVEIVADEQPLYLGGAGATNQQALDFVTELGPTRTALEGQPSDLVAAVRADLLAAFDSWRDAIGVALSGGVLYVSARPGQRLADPVGPAA